MNLSSTKRQAIETMAATKMTRDSIAQLVSVSVRVVNAVLDGVAPHLQEGSAWRPMVAKTAEPKRSEPKRAGVSRFGHAKIEVERSCGLKPDHPALSEARTIFPSQVTGTLGSPRFLVSGHNNPKLGKQVLKGEREGWPIYHLTLEERATCPRSCHSWASCYGNAMPYARRHRPDAAFLTNLSSELLQMQRQHPNGFLVRLHTLGDFYSVPYVLFWAEHLAQLSALHVFGYTARRADDADPETARIARAIGMLTRAMWRRFAIRTSHVEPGAERSIVVDEPPTAEDVILCPAQTEKTAACATCGLCWIEAARPKTIAFLRHGMKRRGKASAEPDEAAQPDPKSGPICQPAEAPVALIPAVVPRKAPATPPDGAPRTGPKLEGSVPLTWDGPAAATPKPSAPLAELPTMPNPRPRPQSRAIPRGARFENLGDGVSIVRVRPVSRQVAAWARAYRARGVSAEVLADLFSVDLDALQRAMNAQEIGAAA
ncbi:MAG: hypothetical protein JWQ97_962 [Phenylobacterium sp.]|nr:hypothetical protein [Phenylobacterium sp.]